MERQLNSGVPQNFSERRFWLRNKIALILETLWAKERQKHKPEQALRFTPLATSSIESFFP